MRLLMACTAIGLALSLNGALAQTTVDPAQTGGTGGTVVTPTTGGTGGDTTTTTGGTQTSTGGTQTSADGGTTTVNPNEGAFSSMSPGNQKITEALFNAQKAGSTEAPAATTEGTSTGAGGTQSATSALSLDDIAARKQDGQGFGVIFKDMKSEGLVDAKNLGQLVSGKEGQTAPEPAEGALEGTSGTSQTDGTTQTTTAQPSTGKISASGRKPATVVTLGDGSTVGATRERGQSATKSRGSQTSETDLRGSGQGSKSASAGITTAGGSLAHGGGNGKSHAPTSGSGGNQGAGIVSAGGGGAADAKVHGGGNGGGQGGGRGGK